MSGAKELPSVLNKLSSNETLKVNPTITVISEKDLTVETGGGMEGYGCVVVYEPSLEHRSESLALNPEEGHTRGTGFAYFDVARISVNDKIVWVNRDLPEAPTGRQDINKTGILKLELFDSTKLRERFEKQTEALKLLGLSLLEDKNIQE